MKYTKPALTRKQQADLLISRGMTGDRDQIITQLSAVNYYRLSGYWHTFRLLPAHDFSPNTTFDKVWTFQNGMSNFKQRSGSTAAERRHVVAMGASPWIAGRVRELSPNGTAGIAGMRDPVAPLGLRRMVASVNHGLAPVATSFHPFGTNASLHARCRLVRFAAERRHDVATGARPWNATMVDVLAAERRHVVAMGVSPWIVGNERELSPNGTTGIAGMQRPVAPLGLRWMCASVTHGLAPVATTCRPFVTKTTEQMPRLVAELHAQFAESAKLEQAIKANLRGLGYGG